MCGPIVYIFQDHRIGKPKINSTVNTFTFNYFEDKEYFQEKYDRAVMNLYMAPDCYWPYANGHTPRNEFKRYSRWIFKNLIFQSKEKDDRFTICLYEYDTCKNDWFNFGDPELKTDIPLGDLADMTYKETQEYLRICKLQFTFKKRKI